MYKECHYSLFTWCFDLHYVVLYKEKQYISNWEKGYIVLMTIIGSEDSFTGL